MAKTTTKSNSDPSGGGNTNIIPPNSVVAYQIPLQCDIFGDRKLILLAISLTRVSGPKHVQAMYFSHFSVCFIRSLKIFDFHGHKFVRKSGLNVSHTIPFSAYAHNLLK